MGSARKRVLGKSVVTVLAICISYTLWGNNEDLKLKSGNRDSVRRRHLLQKESDDDLKISVFKKSDTILPPDYSLEQETNLNTSSDLEPSDRQKSGNTEQELRKELKITKEEANASKPLLKDKDSEGDLKEEPPPTNDDEESPKKNGRKWNNEQPQNEMVEVEDELTINKGKESYPENGDKGEPNSKVAQSENDDDEGHKGHGTKKHEDVGKGLIDHKSQQETLARNPSQQSRVPVSTPKPRKGYAGPNAWHNLKGQGPPVPIEPTFKTPKQDGATAIPFEFQCTAPAYHEFPPDLFSNKQRARGAIIIHVFVIIYMFYAVAVVCDDYFIASLEECCLRLNLSEDVAGATFMAAGSSAPELFTAILGVLVAKGDVGTGTIVGSAVFNVLFVIGICGICAGRVVELTWWPLFRDSVFYSCTVVLLIAIIFDTEVTWYESVIMILVYAVYIVLMKFNNDVHFWMSRRLGIEDEVPQNIAILAKNDKKNYSSYVPFNNEIDECASMPVTARFTLRPPPPDENILKHGFTITSVFEASLLLMIGRESRIRPVTRFRVAAFMVIVEHRRLKKEANKMQQGQLSMESHDLPPARFKTISSGMGLTAESNWKSLPTREEGIVRFLKWLVQAPLLAVLHYTILDCRKDEYRKYFMFTFFGSIAWTAVFSYIMVWMVTLVGYTLNIPDSIMGITFLAAGTSVPDAFASLIVARQGQGDMAVSNSLGSNIFDILIGLALPWFMQTALIDPGSIATINSKGMVYSVILLFLTIIITIGGIFFNRWQLTYRLGIMLITVYFLFIIISMLLEFNFLGHVNPPMCRD